MPATGTTAVLIREGQQPIALIAREEPKDKMLKQREFYPSTSSRAEKNTERGDTGRDVTIVDYT